MRTLDELEKMAANEDIAVVGGEFEVCVIGDIDDELRHLIAIARAADYRLNACKEGNQDSFAAADDLLDSEVDKARNAGLFGGEVGR